MKKPIKLKLQKTFKVKPTKPFAFDPTFHKPDHFTSGDNFWEPGIRWQTWNWQGKCLGIKFSNKGTNQNPLVEIKIYAKEELPKDLTNSLVEEIKYLYNFDLDLTDFYKTFSKDKILMPRCAVQSKCSKHFWKITALCLNLTAKNYGVFGVRENFKK